MPMTGRRRRSTMSVAPSPTTSPSSSSPSASAPREPRPSSRLLQWKFSQVLGELPPTAEAHRDNDEDEILAVEFDGRGEYLAAGDSAGRVILFRRTDDGIDGARPRAELERADRAGAPLPRYSYATEFQSHEQEVSHTLIE